MKENSWHIKLEENKINVYLPKPPKENITSEMREGAFHHDSYVLGRRHAINDCIFYLKQQGYHVVHESDEEESMGVKWMDLQKE